MARRFAHVMRPRLTSLLALLQARMPGLGADGTWLGPDFRIYLTQGIEQPDNDDASAELRTRASVKQVQTSASAEGDRDGSPMSKTFPSAFPPTLGA
jgi:hypothetical protein